MNDREAFIRRICQEPRDYTVRLVFADWLDEQENKADADRALWIRGTIDEHRSDLNLWAALAMFGDDIKLLMSMGQCVIRGGFIEKVGLPLMWFMRVAKKLFQRHPITSVILTDREPRVNGSKTFSWRVQNGNQRPTPENPWDGFFTYCLPNEFRHFLKNSRNKIKRPSQSDSRLFNYPSACSANDDLDSACVRYGRWLAGLPRTNEVLM